MVYSKGGLSNPLVRLLRLAVNERLTLDKGAVTHALTLLASTIGNWSVTDRYPNKGSEI